MNREGLILEIQEKYRHSGRTLNELQRRHWAATEAVRLGRGGITLVSKALRISPNTIKRGIQEIACGQTGASLQASERIRKPGGGRKSKTLSADRFSQIRPNKDVSTDSIPDVAPSEFPDARASEASPNTGDLKPKLENGAP